MKKLLSAIFVISSLFVSAQFPQGINYQSIIRNTSGVVLPSTPVTVEFKLYSSPTSSISTVLLYDETHSATTNSFGMVNLVIGHGTPIGGIVTFNNIPWIIGIEYEVWVNSSQVGTRQPFMSVPYAFNALTADWAPAPAVTYSNNILSVGGNTVTIPAGPTYTAGTGISISGNTITNNAPDQTVSVTGLGSATVTGTYPNFTIETPTVSAAASPTITGAGSATVTSSGNTFTVNTPVPTVYTAGNGIDITGGVISNTATAATPTITGTGAANVTSAGNSYTVDVPAAVTPSITGTGAATVTSVGNSFTIDVAPAVTQTVTGTGIAVVTPSTGSSVNVDVPAPVLSYNQGTKELSITQGSAVTTQTLTGTGSNTVSIVGSDLATVTPTTGSSFTVSVPTPSMTVVGGSLSGSYPTQTLTISSSSTTLVQGNNVTLNQSGSTYTVNSVTPTLNVIGGSLSGSYPNQTLTIPTQTTYVGTPGNISVSSNTINLITTAVTAGTYGNNGSNAVPTFSVDNFGRLTSAAQYTPTVSGDVINSINTTTVAGLRGRPVAPTAPTANQVLAWNGSAWTPSTVATAITGTGTGVATVTTSAANFTVNVPAPTYNPATGVLATGSQSVTVAPTLALSGTTLTSGASTNSVNLATLPGLWSASSTTAVVLTTNSNNVGIGTVPAAQFKLDVAATAGNSVTIHGFNTGATDAFAGVFGENNNNGIGVYGQSNGGKGVFGKSTSGAGVHGESVTGDAGRFLMTGAGASYGVQVQTNGTGAALYAKSNYAPNPLAAKFDGNQRVVGNSTLDSSLMMTGYAFTPGVSISNQGRIFFNGTKFMVSENAGPYKPLFSATPWVQGAGTVTLTNPNDRVGIGTNAPNAALEVAVSNTVTDGIQVNMNNAANGSNAVQVMHNGVGKAGHFEINNTSNSSPALYAKTNGQAPGITVEQMGTARAIDARIFGSSNTSSVIYAQSGGLGSAGFFEVFNPGNNSNAVTAVSYGTGATIFGNNAGTAGAAGFFNIPGGSPNTSPALLATNIASGNALNANAGSGSAISASNSSSVSATMNLNQGGIGDAAQIFATQGRALFLSNNSNSGYSTLESTNNGTGPVISAYKNNSTTAGNVASFSNNSTSNSSDAVLIANNGPGNGIYVGKPAGTTGGNVGKFDNLSSSNAADAVFITNNGAGAALHAVNGPTVTGGSNLALMIENGHIGSTASSVITASTNTSCGCIGSLTMDGHSTDVVGTLRAVFSSTTGAIVDITVTFTKPYKKYPVVMITPTESPNAGNSYPKYIVVPVGVPGNYTGFRLTIVGGGVNNPGSYGYNYMVIEGK